MSTRSDTREPLDARKAALLEWLDGLDGIRDPELHPASEDASFRRYFRVVSADETFIAMDAPPEREDCGRFVRIAGYLGEMGLHAPRVIEANFQMGFLLLSDLGSTPYLDALRNDRAAAGVLYPKALRALAALRRNGAAFQAHLPPYDEKLLRRELTIFREWLCERYLSVKFSGTDETAWKRLCDALVRSALEQPRVFVHRDFHSRNLMVTESNSPGILDFQDAVEGPITYDLVSLLKDCYFRLPADRVRSWMTTFYEGLGDSTRAGMDEGRFLRFADLMGVQRHLKAAGIFARLHLRDGKSDYLNDIPTTLAYIVEIGRSLGPLDWIAALIEERVLPRITA